MHHIRKILKSDLEDLKQVLNSIELFSSEYLGDMISGYFNHPDSEDIWFTASENDQAVR